MVNTEMEQQMSRLFLFKLFVPSPILPHVPDPQAVFSEKLDLFFSVYFFLHQKHSFSNSPTTFTHFLQKI